MIFLLFLKWECDLSNNIKFSQEKTAYEGEPRFKDYYSTAYDLFKKEGVKSVLDIGSASGDFLYFLPNDIRGVGIDKSAELVEIARSTRQKPNLEFLQHDILADEPLEYEFDAVLFSGLLVTLDQPRAFFERVLHLKPKVIFASESMNEQGIDIRLGYRRAEAELIEDYNFSFNVLSIQTIQNILSDLGVKSYDFQRYQMDTNLEKDDNVLRSYHTEFEGERVQTNGLGIILRGYHLVVRP